MVNIFLVLKIIQIKIDFVLKTEPNLFVISRCNEVL